MYMYNWPFSLTYILSHSLVAHLLLVCCVYLDDNAETTPDSEGIRVQSESSKRKGQLERKKKTYAWLVSVVFVTYVRTACSSTNRTKS